MSAPSSLLRFSSWAYFRFISASSSSSKTSMRACSRVFPQRTESRGSTSSSKRKISLSSTRVFFETPLNYGMAQGVLTVGMLKPVWQAISYIGALSVSSVTNWSVWMSIFCLPVGASGVLTSRVKNSSAACARFYSRAFGSYFFLLALNN